MKTLFALIALGLVSVTPVFAAEGGAAAPAGTLSYVEFSGLPENRSVSERLVQRRYDEYRRGRLPVATLDVSQIR